MNIFANHNAMNTILLPLFVDSLLIFPSQSLMLVRKIIHLIATASQVLNVTRIIIYKDARK